MRAGSYQPGIEQEATTASASDAGGTPGVSWIGHLGGLIGGIASGWIFRTRRTVPGTVRGKVPGDPGGRPPATTVAVPADNPRADLHKELGDLGL